MALAELVLRFQLLFWNVPSLFSFPSASNPCEKNDGRGPCSHLCLINYNRTASCTCPHLMKLSPNKQSCFGRPEPTSLFVSFSCVKHFNNIVPLALGSGEKVPPVRAALWNPRCGHRRPVHEHHDGSDCARHRRCHCGGLRCHGGEDLLGGHQNSNHQTGLHQRHPVGNRHFCRWVLSRQSMAPPLH